MLGNRFQTGTRAARAGRLLLAGAAILLPALVVSPAVAQLFGSRNLGQPLSRRPRPMEVANATAGQISGTERFLRGNRERTDFVARTSARPRNSWGWCRAHQRGDRVIDRRAAGIARHDQPVESAVSGAVGQ